MDVTSATATAATAVDNTASSTSMITSDFQTFLTLLTAQIQNQDPLNPMDNSEFATQLATFSGVEQQVHTNDLLSELQSTMALSGMSQMADWIGREARAEMPMSFQGEPLTLYAPENTLADYVELVVTDSDGNSLQRLSVPATETAFLWAGVTTDGSPLPEGVYGFHIEYFNNETSIGTAPAQGYGEIEEAQIIDGEVWLSFAGGVQIRSSLVEAMR